MDGIICPIWKTPAEHLADRHGRDGLTVRSPRAGGTYFISRTAIVNLESSSEMDRVKLTHEIVSHEIVGSRIEISSITIDALRSIPTAGVVDRSIRLLRYLIRSSARLGMTLEFPPDWKKSDDPYVFMSWPEVNFASAPLLAWSDSLEWEEVFFLLKVLEEDGLIVLSDRVVQPDIVVTAKGYVRLEQAVESIQGDQAFVAMWFDESMAQAYAEGIEKGIREAGYRPLLIDSKEHVNKIDDEIVGEIRRSRFVVADFTSAPDRPRGGVYFEAGYAMGRGIPVIWTCRANLIDQVHFDTRQFNHIVWKNA